MSKSKKVYQAFKSVFKALRADRMMDDYFIYKKFADTVGPLHFSQAGRSGKELRAFFKKQLIEIEVETHAFCNRRCSFCPNSIFTRHDRSQLMSDDVFGKIIDELAGIDYSNTLKLHRYNEPLAQPNIYSRVEFARLRLPRAWIGFHSNGDLVTSDALQRLEKAGLSFINISLYLEDAGDIEENPAGALEHAHQFLKSRGLQGRQIETDSHLIKFKIDIGKLEAVLFVPYIIRMANDRGGVLKQFSHAARVSPCSSPFGRMFVDWTGNVLPCCNLRGDVPAHQGMIMGNASRQSLQEIFFSQQLNGFRRDLLGFGEKRGVCRTCHYGLFEQNKLSEGLGRKLCRKYHG